MSLRYSDAIAVGSRLVLRIRNSITTLPGLSVNHKRVLTRLAEEGGVSVRYGVLTCLSCAIAVLGLLLSSPAIIIGAMLISPLMSPIILFGFSLATLDYVLLLRSLSAIVLGTLLALALAALIVWISPLQSITPEILSRTNPNFFDLLVAAFSATAGAYAVVQHRGETLVGVAIATALMPPLAVVGYGLATQNWVVFGGAFGLYMTNLLAIGLTASLVAKLFGFGRSISGRSTFWQTAIIFTVFLMLSIPLGFSLKRIAVEAVQTSTVRETLNDYWGSASNHIYKIDVSFPAGRPIQVEALVLVHMWNGLAGKCFFRCFTTLGRCGHMYGLSARLLTAGLDEVRDARG